MRNPTHSAVVEGDEIKEIPIRSNKFTDADVSSTYVSKINKTQHGEKLVWFQGIYQKI